MYNACFYFGLIGILFIRYIVTLKDGDALSYSFFYYTTVIVSNWFNQIYEIFHVYDFVLTTTK